MVFHKDSYEAGRSKEIECLPKLKKLIDSDLFRLTDTFDSFDYFNGTDLYIELKSRNIEYSKYPSVFMNNTKFKKIRDGFNYLFVFLYTDGLYYIEYDKDIFDKFESRQIWNSKFNRFYDLRLIPTNLLIKLE